VNSARLILFCLLAAVPMLVLIDVPIILGLVSAITSAGLLAVASWIKEGEAGFLLAAIRPILGIAIVPAIWIVVQVLPLSIAGIAHPIWESAEQALGQPISGSISIDRGASLLALVRYLTIFAIVLLAAAVTVNRTGAEWVLFASVAVGSLMSIVMIGQTVANSGISAKGRVQVRECVALGIVVSFAALIRTFERYETKHLHPERSSITLRWTFIACLVAFALCVAGLSLDMTSGVLFASAYAVGMLLAVVAIRRFRLGLWGSLAIAAVGAMTAIATIASRLAPPGIDLTLAFVSDEPEAAISTTQRVLADAPWWGTGAGTFAFLLPVYRDAGDFVTAPSAASKIAIELGHPMFWILVVLVVVGIALLLRGAMLRGRDSFYPTAGASSLLLLLLLSFCENGLLGTPVSILAAAIVGLAFAQSKSRTL
jgi:hypothetical protein